MDITAAITQMGILILIVILGFFLSKVNYIDKPMSDKLTKLLINVTLPCMIIAAVGNMDFDAAVMRIPWAVVLSIVFFACILVASVIITFILFVPKADRACYIFMGITTNTGFMGMPIIASVCGDQTVIVSSIFVTVVAVFIYSVGFGILSVDQQKKKALASDSIEGYRITIPWKSIVNPAMIASVVAIIMLLAQVRLPGVLEGAMSMVGSMTAPISMMVVGFFLSTITFKELFAEWRMFPMALLRFLVVPVAAFFLMRLFVEDPTLLSVFVLMMAMPVGSMVPAFVGQFEGNAVLASKGTIVTTTLSFAFIPLLLTVMML